MTDSVLELRQYTLHPGKRDTLIELFEREFIEPQEAAGMTLVGQFRDFDNPDRFVWLRSFPDMMLRRQALAAFYGGPVWKKFRDEANATMIDSDNVLLLRPMNATSAFSPPSISQTAASIIVATIYYVDEIAGEEFQDRNMTAATQPLACYVTETAENTYPALPVRTGENVVVSFSRDGASPAGISNEGSRPIEQLRLQPTIRSRLR